VIAWHVAVAAVAGDLVPAPGELLHTRGMRGPDSCITCHRDEGAQWTGSRHQQSWSNPLIQVAFAAEPLEICVRCHLPLPEQTAEVMANRDFYRSLDPDSELVAGTIERRPEPTAAHGIHCGTCHVRDGVVLTSVPSYDLMHGSRHEPRLSSSDFCIGCHDFPAHHVVNGVTRFTDLPMQATGAEWRAWQAAGGTEDCQDCHMPDGDHRMRGAHDVGFVRDAVEVTRSGDALVLEAVGVGHHLPTGDIFRHLTVEARVGDDWVVIDWIGRELGIDTTPDGELAQVEVVDTALRPGVPRRVPLPTGAVGWRVQLHYAADAERERGLLDDEQLMVTLHESR